MKKLMIIALMCMAMTTSTSCTSKDVEWSNAAGRSGKIVTETRQVKNFKEIKLAGIADVYYTQGSKYSVKVAATSDDLQKVITKVDGQTLVIDYEDSKKFLGKMVNNKRSRDIKVYVTSPDIVGVNVTGTGDFESRGNIDTDRLDVKMNGVGDIELKSVICDNLTVLLNGTGDVDIEKADALTAKLEQTGVGDIDVKLKNTRNTEIKVTGVGDADVEFDRCGHVDATLTGVGDIELKGTITSLDKKKTGVGDLDIKNLRIGK